MVRQFTEFKPNTTYKHDFQPITGQHETKVLIGRHRRTIYARKVTGADVMLDLMRREGYMLSYSDDALSAETLKKQDILVIHGAPVKQTEV